eukprot:757846-Hanusia_phi.AAC.3
MMATCRCVHVVQHDLPLHSPAPSSMHVSEHRQEDEKLAIRVTTLAARRTLVVTTYKLGCFGRIRPVLSTMRRATS